jgi:TolB protein
MELESKGVDMYRRITLSLAVVLALIAVVVAQAAFAGGGAVAGRLAGPWYTPQERQALIEYANASFAQKRTLAGATTNGLLVFQRQIGKHVQLFTVRPDGRGIRQVTHLPDSDALGGEWSPDGRSLVFARDYGLGTKKEHLDIETIGADGRHAHAFGLEGLNGWPIWSPDGERILWVRAPGLALANPDGSDVQLVRVPGDNSTPSFSPDGKRVVLRRDVPGGVGIYVVNVDGTGSKRIVLSKKGIADKISWSPDGSRIAFSMPECGSPSCNVYTIRPDGTGLRRLTHDTAGKVNNGVDCWSPDGRKIAFASDRDGTYQIHVMNADGSGVTQLTHGAESHFAAWGTHA